MYKSKIHKEITGNAVAGGAGEWKACHIMGLPHEPHSMASQHEIMNEKKLGTFAQGLA